MTKENEEYYKISRKTLIIGIIAILVIIAVLAGIYYKGGFDKFLGKNQVAEKGPPPKFELIAIENPGCTECMNASMAVEIIKGAPTVNITSDKILSFESEEAKKLIKKYSIERLPAFILKGKNLNVNLTPFEKKSGALVFAKSPPVYYDLKEERVVGKVTAVIITKPDCKKCFNVSKLVDQLELYGVAIIGKQEIGYNSKEGLALIKEYNITKIPTLILSEDAIYYDLINASWKKLGGFEKDGKLVMRTVNAPYYDIRTKKTKGFVDLTYVVDGSCTTCYNPTQFKTYFEQSFSVAFDEVKTVDVSSSEGKAMVKKYNITLVPTAVFSSDLKEYPAIKEIWNQVGKVVNGTYVFTKVNNLQGVIYKDISTGKILGEGPKNIQVQMDDQIE